MLNKLLLISDKDGFPTGSGLGKECHWLFLGRDYDRLLMLKRSAPQGFHYVDIGDLLNKCSFELRRPYLDYIGSLSLRFDSLAWWISRVSEKNVMASPVYLYVCYLAVIRRLVQGRLKDEDICIVAESPALLETIKHLPEFSDHKVSGSSDYRFNLIKSIFKSFYRMVRFIYQSIYEKTIIWQYREVKKNDHLLTVIRTWVGEKNLGKDGGFKDSYFPGLADHLEQQGKRVAILPILYSVKRSFKESLRWFRGSRDRFVIPQDHYHPSDYLRAIFLSFRSSWCFSGSFAFNEMDLGRLFREDAVKNVFAGGALRVIMQYFLPKRLRNKGVKIDRFIITFENMFPEKPLIQGVAKYMPGTKVIGFQHASLFPLLLSCYTSRDEARVLPLPDKIVTSGGFFKKILIQEGFPADRFVDGPALRFQYLLRQPAGSVNGRPKNMILVALPLARPSALELLSKVWSAVKDRPDLSVKIKAHPMMPADELAGILDKAGWVKDRYQKAGGSMADVLPQVSMVIATASAAIFDAVASGVPVIRVRSDVDLSLDPMDWFPPDASSHVARTSAQISSEIDKLVALGQDDLLKLKSIGKELVGQCFSPVTERTMAAFIN